MDDAAEKDERPDYVARDAIKAILGKQPEWRDDEKWWFGVVRIANRLLEEAEVRRKELEKTYSTIGTLRRVMETGISQAEAEERARAGDPLPVISMKRWRQSIKEEAERRREKGGLHMEGLAREAGISVSTLQRIINPKRPGGVSEG